MRKNKLTKDEFVERATKVHGDKYDYTFSNYVDYNTKLKIYCPKHNQYFLQTPKYHIYRKHGCPKCGGSENITLSDFISRANITHDNKYDYSYVVFKSMHQKIKIRCKIHDYIFSQSPANHIYHKKGCPMCSASIGETEIYNLLKNEKIKLSYNHAFEDCINYKTNRTLRFDFYLPAYNTCIEFDGKQHFQEIELFGGKEALEYLQFKDNIKNEYCKNKGIRLIRLSKIEEINNLITLLNTP